MSVHLSPSPPHWHSSAHTYCSLCISTFANTLISHNYTWRVATSERTGTSFRSRYFHPKFSGSRRVGFHTLAWCHTFSWTWAWCTFSIHAPWVGCSLSTPCSSLCSLNKTYLGPPVPLGASGDEKPPSITVTGDPAGSMPPATPISSRSSLKVLRHVFFGLPLFLLPSTGTQYIAVWAGLSLCSLRTWPATFLLLVVTMSWSRSMPALLITSSFVTWSRHEMPRGLHAGSGDERHLICERTWPFSSTSHTKTTWASLLPQCGFHLDRKESKETLHSRIACLRTIHLLGHDQLVLSEWWGFSSWKLQSNPCFPFHGYIYIYILSYHNQWEHAS